MSKSQPSQPAVVHADNVIWLDKNTQQRASPSEAGRQASSKGKAHQQVLTAMAGLDVLEVELLGACPQDRKSMYMVAARAAATRSRRTLCNAYPILAAVEPIELLYVATIVRGVDAGHGLTTSPNTSVDIGPPHPRGNRMRFESMASRSGRITTQRPSAAMALMLSIPLLATVYQWF